MNIVLAYNPFSSIKKTALDRKFGNKYSDFNDYSLKGTPDRMMR
jgi:hypothetical protein